MDVTNIQYDDGCFDFIIDKGTLDCVLGSPFDSESKVKMMLDVNCFLRTFIYLIERFSYSE